MVFFLLMITKKYGWKSFAVCLFQEISRKLGIIQ